MVGDTAYHGARGRSESRSKTETNLMVFVRPVVMRDADTANRRSLDRYEQMRGFQKDMQPPRSVIVPIIAGGLFLYAGYMGASTFVDRRRTAREAAAAAEADLNHEQIGEGDVMDDAPRDLLGAGRH